MKSFVITNFLFSAVDAECLYYAGEGLCTIIAWYYYIWSREFTTDFHENYMSWDEDNGFVEKDDRLINESP
jgi:hypothetical protein